jgi:polysaccharide export outer membrane protein
MSLRAERTAPGSRRFLALCWLLALPGPLAGQNPPISQSQAQQLLQQAQSNPGLADQLRQRIQASGLTPDQIRARLSASGYPSTFLDAYLSPSEAGQQSLTPGADQLAAMEALGLPAFGGPVLPTDTGLLRAGLRPISHVFGVDAFRRSTTQFLPLLSGPVPPDYRLGAGDQLVLILTGDVEQTYPLLVTREGFVLIPQVGQMYVANLTMDQLRQALYDRLGKAFSGVRRGADARTRFDVAVANVRVNQVYVVGEVTQPGSYQISALGTVMTALYAAGGPTERGNTRQIEVRRAGKLVTNVDLYDYLLHGNTQNDVRLETGDVVYVPVYANRIQIVGAVPRPAVYDFLPGQTLSDAIKTAGGFRPDAALRRVSVLRILPGAARGPGPAPRAMIDVQLTSGGADSALHGVVIPPVPLMTGDSVVVDSLASLGQSYYVAIAGMVNKPGAYPWRPGITLRDLVLIARGPRVGADLKEAEVARLPSDRSGGQLASTIRVPLDSTYLLERDSSGRFVGPPGVVIPAMGAADVVLQPYDNVLILRQPDFDLQRTVTLLGEVRYPGTYSLKTKTDRMMDLLNRAGGLTAHAYPDGIRFYRNAKNVGRIDVDLTEAMKDSTSRYNVILQASDSIEIPEFEPSVKVSGAVNSPGSVVWQRGMSLSDFISAAGGFAQHADKDNISVRYANGRVETRHHHVLWTNNPAPGPGSEVFVPAEDPLAPHTDYTALFGAIAQILASTVAIIVIAVKG